jgi:ribosome-associated heat shock protein Hsp15
MNLSAMTAPASVRLDKWLWAVRVFKTRSLATQACRLGRVKIDGQPVKPSHTVRPGELILVTTGVVTRTLRVLEPLEHRVGAKLVPQFAGDLTPPAEYEKERLARLPPLFPRPKGSGRPTKKDRRQIERFV